VILVAFRQGFRKGDFDGAPATGKIGIAWRQGPQAMQVVRQNDPGIDTKGRPEARPADRLAQHIDTRHQPVEVAIEQIQGKKEGPARNSIAAIVRHGTSMPGLGERRNALPLCALHLLRRGEEHDFAADRLNELLRGRKTP
jgi:hypothetical protein